MRSYYLYGPMAFGATTSYQANLGFGSSAFNSTFNSAFNFNKDDHSNSDSDEKPNYPRKDVDCKSRKDAKDKAQQYGGGEPPEGPHHDPFGSHFHAMRRRNNKREKIPNVHFKYETKKPFIHKIKKGDCLSKIAEKYHVSVNNLQKWNNIKNKDLIYTGNTLKIYQ